MEWTQRAKVYDSDAAQLRRYRSRNGWFAVVQTRSHFGLGSHWLAIHVTGPSSEHVISTHRSKRRAVAACGKFFRKQGFQAE